MLSQFFIRRPKFAIVISIIITLAGVIALTVIPVAEFPDISPPQVNVSTSYPGASAEVVESTVGKPIESEINGVDNMLYMSSTSSGSGSYSLSITFAIGTDPDIAAVNVQNRVALAEAKLPADVQRNGVSVTKSSSSMLMVVSLFSPKGTYDSLYLSNYASVNVRDALLRVPGVGNASILGALDYSMRIWIDPNKLTALRLTADDVIAAIRSQNIQATAGEIGAPPIGDNQQFQYSITAHGRLSTPRSSATSSSPPTPPAPTCG